MIDQDAAYLHMTTNNTIYGSRYNQFPETGNVPLIADQTSEILSRVIDYSKFGCIYAGLQKNLGPSGTAIVVIREDLLGHASPETPVLLNYEQCAKDNSLTNTANTFAVYVTGLVLEWLQEQGGVEAIEKVNEQKAKTLYDIIDAGDYYRGVIQPECRGTMNVSFNLPSEELEAKFLKEAGRRGFMRSRGIAASAASAPRSTMPCRWPASKPWPDSCRNSRARTVDDQGRFSQKVPLATDKVKPDFMIERAIDGWLVGLFHCFL